MRNIARSLLACSLALFAGGIRADQQTGTRCRCNTQCLSRSQSGGWYIYRSENFELRSRAVLSDADYIVRRCEETRSVLLATWMPPFADKAWVTQCTVVVHTSAGAYSHQTGANAATKGVSSLEIGDGRVWKRRVDLLADAAGWCDAVIPHELTHVVLADHFTAHQIPRWADEGFAILSEPGNRLAESLDLVDISNRSGALIPLRDLLNASTYPQPPSRAKLFFAQSAAFSAFLAQDHQELLALRFAETSSERGYDKAVIDCAVATDLKDLDAKFHVWLRQRDVEVPKLVKQNADRRQAILSTAIIID